MPYSLYPKKNGKVRLILDSTATNILFRGPPPTDLVTGEGLGRIEVDVDSAEDENWANNLVMAFGVADVSDCFHRMFLDGPICSYFCWPPCLAGDVGISEVQGKAVEPYTKIWPMQRSLGMVFVGNVLCTKLQPNKMDGSNPTKPVNGVI